MMDEGQLVWAVDGHGVEVLVQWERPLVGQCCWGKRAHGGSAGGVGAVMGTVLVRGVGAVMEGCSNLDQLQIFSSLETACYVS